MTVELKIDGKVHSGWKHARITRGIERAASDFDLTVTEKVPGDSNPPRIKPGSACELWAEGEKVVTGYVDEVNTAVSATRRTFTFRGRSKVADLVDCSAINEPGEWANVSLAKIAADIAGQYGVSVDSRVSVDPFTTFRIQPGERAFDAIERACRMRAVLFTDDPAGRLVITRAGTERAGTQIRQTVAERERNNVLQSNALYSYRDRYSEYIVKGQAVGTDDVFGDDAAAVTAKATDGGTPRKRVLILPADTQSTTAGARERAEWEAAVRRGKSLRASYTLQGWRQADGTLWRPNMIVSVLDDLNRVSGDLLISEVSYSLGEDGRKVTMSVVPPEAFERIPEAEKASGGGGSDPLSKYLDG